MARSHQRDESLASNEALDAFAHTYERVDFKFGSALDTSHALQKYCQCCCCQSCLSLVSCFCHFRASQNHKHPLYLQSNSTSQECSPDCQKDNEAAQKTAAMPLEGVLKSVDVTPMMSSGLC